MTADCELLIVSGPNGSGKTTLAELYAVEFGYPYIAADKIAAAIAPNRPETQRIEASRQFSVQVADIISQRHSVIIESTLSGRTFVRMIERAKRNAFSVSLVHLFLDSVNTCIARVAERVQKGGHDVPQEDIRRRFTRSAANFWNLYRPLCDRWLLLYNSISDAQLVAEGGPTTHATQDKELFTSFMQIVAAND